MEDKKFEIVKIAHLVIMVLGVSLYFCTLFKVKEATSSTTDLIIGILQCVTAILALASGFLYLIHGYKKDAAKYYKGFVWILLIKDAISTVAGNASHLYLDKFVWVICLVLLTILTVGKDLGKVKSFVLVGLILAGKITLLVSNIVTLKLDSLLAVAIFIDIIGQIILIITTGLMVCAKYIDKASRGAK